MPRVDAITTRPPSLSIKNSYQQTSPRDDVATVSIRSHFTDRFIGEDDISDLPSFPSAQLSSNVISACQRQLSKVTRGKFSRARRELTANKNLLQR